MLVAMRAPSGDQPIPQTFAGALCVTSVAPVRASHTCAVPSWLAEAIFVPSGDQAIVADLASVSFVGQGRRAGGRVPDLDSAVGAARSDLLAVGRPHRDVDVLLYAHGR